MLFFHAALTLLLIIKPPANTVRCFVLVTLWASSPFWLAFFFLTNYPGNLCGRMEMGATDASLPASAGEGLERLWSCSGVAERWAACGWPLSILSRSPCLSARACGLHVTTAPRSFVALSVGSCGSRTGLQVGWGPRRDLGPGPCVLWMLKSSMVRGRPGDLLPLAGWADGNGLWAEAPSSRPCP